MDACLRLTEDGILFQTLGFIQGHEEYQGSRGLTAGSSAFFSTVLGLLSCSYWIRTKKGGELVVVF